MVSKYFWVSEESNIRRINFIAPHKTCNGTTGNQPVPESSRVLKAARFYFHRSWHQNADAHAIIYFSNKVSSSTRPRVIFWKRKFTWVLQAKWNSFLNGCFRYPDRHQGFLNKLCFPFSGRNVHLRIAFSRISVERSQLNCCLTVAVSAAINW